MKKLLLLICISIYAAAQESQSSDPMNSVRAIQAERYKNHRRDQAQKAIESLPNEEGVIAVFQTLENDYIRQKEECFNSVKTLLIEKMKNEKNALKEFFSKPIDCESIDHGSHLDKISSIHNNWIEVNSPFFFGDWIHKLLIGEDVPFFTNSYQHYQENNLKETVDFYGYLIFQSLFKKKQDKMAYDFLVNVTALEKFLSHLKINADTKTCLKFLKEISIKDKANDLEKQLNIWDEFLSWISTDGLLFTMNELRKNEDEMDLLLRQLQQTSSFFSALYSQHNETEINLSRIFSHYIEHAHCIKIVEGRAALGGETGSLEAFRRYRQDRINALVRDLGITAEQAAGML